MIEEASSWRQEHDRPRTDAQRHGGCTAARLAAWALDPPLLIDPIEPVLLPLTPALPVPTTAPTS